MEKEKAQILELFHQPKFEFVEAFTGPDVLSPTHQVVKATIRLRRASIESFNRENALILTFADQFGVDMQIPIFRMEFTETKNPNIISVEITGLFPVSEIYRVDSSRTPESHFEC